MIRNNVVTKGAGLPDGWTAAALSLRGFSADGSAFFKAGGAVAGVVAGFNIGPEGAAFESIDHAIRFAAGVADVVEAGVSKHSIGAYSEEDDFEIRRVGSTVTYYRGATLLYTSVVPSSAAAFLDVSLYASGDYLFDPQLTLGAGSEWVTDTAVLEQVSGAAEASASITLAEFILLAIVGQAEAAATIADTSVVLLEVRGSAQALAAILATEDAPAALVGRAVAAATISVFGAGRDAFAMNLETGGFTRYEGFDFTSFAKVGGTYYGCRPDGIYALDGDTDNGAPIRSMVSFGKQNFGTSALKRVTNAYVGVSGAGRLFLKVLAEGREYTYAQRSYDEHIQTQRFDTGKGLRVNWLEFELYNADGEDFELASVEFAAVPLSRRI